MEKYTNIYKELNSQLEKAETEFNKNPNSKTAKKVSDIRVKMNSLRDAEKFTAEFLQQENEMFKSDLKEIGLKVKFFNQHRNY